MSPHNSEGAPSPSKMPTSSALVEVDPFREILRDKASGYFDQQLYGEFLVWLRGHPAWTGSPTARYLAALSLLYQSETDRVDQPTIREEARSNLHEARLLWGRLWREKDLEGRDATLLHTSIHMAEAWIYHLRGEAEAGRKLILARLHAVVGSGLSRLSDFPDQLHCIFYYLLFFASKEQSQAAINRSFALMEEHFPEWPWDESFTRSIEHKSQFAFAWKQEFWKSHQDAVRKELAALEVEAANSDRVHDGPSAKTELVGVRSAFSQEGDEDEEPAMPPH